MNNGKRGPTERWAKVIGIGERYMTKELQLGPACGRHNIHQPCESCGQCTTAGGGGLRCRQCPREEWGT